MSKEQFKILSPRDHVRQRIGMYMGSAAKEEVDRFVLGKWTKTIYIPALLKMIDELVDNSVDEAIRTKFQYANKIDVTIEGDQVTVTDNGRGIPQEEVLTPEGEKISRPVAAWTRVNAGTSFDETRVTIGTNGVGSSATNFLSDSFIGKTWQNGNLLEVICSDGCNSTKVKMKQKPGNGTQVTFTPDFSLFEVKTLQELDTIALVEDRLVSLQLAFPEIRFSFNGQRIQVNDLKKYSALFTPENASVVIEKTDNLAFFIAASSDGFRSNSFVNGVNTRQGGVYVDYIMNVIIDELVVLIKKKHKVEIGKSVIKNGLTFILFARNFVNPKFDSQTKERLTNPVGNVRDHVETSGVKDFKYLAKKIFSADDIIEPIIAAQIAKKMADDQRDALVAQKKLKKVKVAKHISANKSDQGTLFLVEGDCIEENVKVNTLDRDKSIKDIEIGDYVFTHKNRYRKVLSKSFSLKTGISINGNMYSPDHRLFVYDKNDNTFKFLEVKNISKETHKLVRNRLVHNGVGRGINEVIDIKKGGIVYTDKHCMKFSETHEILFFNETMELVTKTISELKVGDIIVL